MADKERDGSPPGARVSMRVHIPVAIVPLRHE